MNNMFDISLIGVEAKEIKISAIVEIAMIATL